MRWGIKFRKSEEVLLRMRVPKNCGDSISSFEQILRAFVGLRGARLVFQVVKVNGVICFFVRCERSLEPFVRQQLYGYYPFLEIKEVGACLIEKRGGYAYKVGFRIKRERIFAMEVKVDGLVGLLSSMNECLVSFDLRSRYFFRKNFLRLRLKVYSRSRLRCDEVSSFFNQFFPPDLCEVRVTRNPLLGAVVGKSNFLSCEFSQLFHLPSGLDVAGIDYLESRRFEPPDFSFGDFDCLIGKTDYRDSDCRFGLKHKDRRRHLYVLGKTGMGKSTLLENMIFSDICAGKGVAIVDPHGDLAEKVLSVVPKNQTNDVILVDPADGDSVVGFNIFDSVDPSLRPIVASGVVSVFKKLFNESWGPRLEYILRNCVLALLEAEGQTMLGILRMLNEEQYREKILRRVRDPIVRSFWLQEFAKMPDRQRMEAISPIQNKVGQFLSSNLVRNIVGQKKSTVDLKFAMNRQKIVILNLSKGKIGEDSSALLGALFVTRFQLEAMARASVPEEDRVDFYLYVDEFQNFATDAFATILSEARKYRLNLILANQYLAQVPPSVRDAVFGNVGSFLSFQIGADDAEVISKQLGGSVEADDLLKLPKFRAYVRLLIDGMPSDPFSVSTFAPIEGCEERKGLVRSVSCERYSKSIMDVEEKIRRWSMA